MLKDTVDSQPIWDLALLFPPMGQWSVDDYLDLEARTGNHLIEYSNGSIEVLPIPSLKHQAIVTYLLVLLHGYIIANKLGIVRVSPTKVKLWEGKIREPDVLFISNENASKCTDQWFEKVDLAIEIVSPDDPRRDIEIKRREYAQAGISEYWIVDPRGKEVLVLKLEDGEKWYSAHGVFSEGEQASSAMLQGFSVDVTELFAQE